MVKVEIVSYDNDEVIHSVECDDMRKAEKVKRGMDINLDHSRCYTQIVDGD